MRETYLDNFATTRLDPRVLECMMPYLTGRFGNPAVGSNEFGRAAQAVVEKSRDAVRRFMRGGPDSMVIFTSGATESNNLVLRGLAESLPGRCHVVTTVIEHKSVLEPCRWLERRGITVTYVPVNHQGRVDPLDVIRAMRRDTALVSVMFVNNEVGTIQPLAEIGEVTRKRGILLHTDATQGIGKAAFEVDSMNVDLASISAHKLYGPKGVGALFVANQKAHDSVCPQLLGGGQEAGFRSGTSNVPGIAGLGRCVELSEGAADDEPMRIRRLRDMLFERLSATVDGIAVNGDLGAAVPHALNISIAGVRSSALLERLPEIGISSSAACGGKNGHSYVLAALGLPESRIRSAVRFGVGRFNTTEDIEYAAERIGEVVRWIRNRPAFGVA